MRSPRRNHGPVRPGSVPPARRAKRQRESNAASRPLLEHAPQADRAPARRRGARRRDRRSRAAAARATGSTRRPRSPACTWSSLTPSRAASARDEALGVDGAVPVVDAARRRTGLRRSTRARRRAPVAASAQRGSCSPGYHLPWPKWTKPPGAVARSAGGAGRRRARAWSGRARRCSTRRRRDRRWTRTWARRPS